MDWNQVEGNWKQVRGNVKKQWGKLTDDDLTAIDGRREALEGRIQERYGYTKDRVRKEIEEWQRSFASQLNRSSDELADQIDSIRADIQSLTSTVSRIANKQINRAQDKAVETANQAEEAIRQNPLSAVAIAVGLGFLFGVFTQALEASLHAPRGNGAAFHPADWRSDQGIAASVAWLSPVSYREGCVAFSRQNAKLELGVQIGPGRPCERAMRRIFILHADHEQMPRSRRCGSEDGE